MKRAKFSLLGIAAMLLPILLLSLSCLTPPATSATPAAAAPATADPIAHQSDISTLRNQLGEKASAGSVSALETRMAQVEGNIRTLQSQGPGNSYPKTEVYTKAEVDAAVAKAIADLKTAAPWGTSSSSSTGNTGSTTPTTGQVTFTTTPVSIPQLFTANSGSQTVFYTMKIMNGTNAWQYVKPIITFGLASSYSPTTMTSATVSMSSGQCTLSGSGTSGNSTLTNGATNVFSVSPALGISTSSMTIIPIGGCNVTGEFQIGAGQSMDILIQLTNINTSTTVLWNVSNSISSRGI